MGRPKGAKNRRMMAYDQITSITGLSDRLAKIAVEWIADPERVNQREGLKTLAPYVWPRRQAIEMTATVRTIEDELSELAARRGK